MEPTEIKEIKKEKILSKEERKKLMEHAKQEIKLIGLVQEKRALELAVENDFPILLIGETGIGKTYTLQHIAKAQNKKIIRVSLNGEIGINELLGKWLVKEGSTYWQDGILVECMRKGYWIILDEINAALPEVLFCLNALLDDSRSIIISEKDGELVSPNPDFRLFATMNPPEEYVGTKELNKALLSRFPIVLYFKEYDPDTELEIVKYQSGIDDNIARIIVDVGNAIRQLKKERKIWYTCSTRDLVNWARLMACNGNSIEEALCFSVLNKASTEEQPIIKEAIKSASSIQFDWSWTQQNFRKLTNDLLLDIEKLKEKRRKLQEKVDELIDKAKEVKTEANS